MDRSASTKVCPYCGKRKIPQPYAACFPCHIEKIYLQPVSPKNQRHVFEVVAKSISTEIKETFLVYEEISDMQFPSKIFLYKQVVPPAEVTAPWYNEVGSIYNSDQWDDYLIYNFKAEQFDTWPFQSYKDKYSVHTYFTFRFFDHPPITKREDEIVLLRNGKSYPAKDVMSGDIVSCKEKNGIIIREIEITPPKCTM
jgi:hypothetical protein